jgi:hypothetical protein
MSRRDGGDGVMAMPSTRVPPEANSAHVWTQLDVDLRRQAISVVAQMAFHFVQTHPEPSQPEKAHDPSPARRQTAK